MTFSKPLSPVRGDPEVRPPGVRSFSAIEIDQFARKTIHKKFEQLHEDPRPFSAFILNFAGELQMVCFACSWVEEVDANKLRSSKSKDQIVHRHPVVLARRALIRYLLKEAKTFETSGSTSSVFFLNEEGELQLKPTCHVYFYSTLTYITDETHDANHWIVNKIRRWSSLGVQGALLSNVFSPIFISKIVYGCVPPTPMADFSTVLRLLERQEDREISVEVVGRQPTAECSTRRTIVWFQGLTGHDIIQETGKLERGIGSSVCKEEIFKAFLQLEAADKRVLKYSRAKKSAGHYQMLKQVLYKKWEHENNGKWLKRKKNKVDKFWVELRK